MPKQLNYSKKTLIGGFSCVNTRLAFDSFMVIGEKEQKLIYSIRNRENDEMGKV